VAEADYGNLEKFRRVHLSGLQQRSTQNPLEMVAVSRYRLINDTGQYLRAKFDLTTLEI